MRKAVLAPLLLLLAAAANPPSDLAREKAEAARVTIVRDDWGIAHVHGPTDADAVFGMIYAQTEDDFPRIEMNYLTALGLRAEAEGQNAVWQDLRARLYVSPEKLQAEYAASPDWLKRLMNAWADGLNYHLATHPDVHPRVIKHFEPWMALSFTEGSIGGDIERINLDELAKFYCCGGPPEPGKLSSPAFAGEGDRAKRGGGAPPSALWAATSPANAGEESQGADLQEPQGSNGIAIAPKITAAGHALLLINPHTSFYFRSELQMSSDEGLDAYGAVTWGQFFVYQGFNPHAGWMHTSTGADAVDEFAEKIEKRGDGYCYRYGSECRPVKSEKITIDYRTAGGALSSRTFTVYRTHHGPIVADKGGRWISFAMMDRPIPALEQSYLRTKATDLASYLKIADLKANSSNNTMFADDKGEIAYLHPQFVPKRDDRFDYTKPVDGSNPATDWHGMTPLNELPSVLNPPNGWVDNNNNAPWSAAGRYSPKPQDYPRYMDMFGQNFRGIHAMRLLTGSKGWTLDKLQKAAFDSYQPGFAALIPPLLDGYDHLPASNPRKAKLAGPVSALRGWDYRWAADSVPQSLAMFYGKTLYRALVRPAGEAGNKSMMRLARDTTPEQKLQSLSWAVDKLTADFGRWQVPWGEINRFQRLSPLILSPFDDSKPSIPVPFASSAYGSLASFGATPEPGTKRWYGTSGNSFVAVVEFGPKIRARGVTAGGESGHPDSPHFRDEAERYASGNLRDIYFYPGQLKGHTERVYHPGG